MDESRRRLLLFVVALLATGVGVGRYYLSRPTPPPTLLTLAGGGRPGYRDAVGLRARFDSPSALAVGQDGSVYVADTNNQVIRRIGPEGKVTTLAGRPGRPGWADGQGSEALFHGPMGLALDADGSLYVADFYNHRIRRVSPRGEVTTVAGDGRAASRDGPALKGSLKGPRGLALAPGGTLVIAEMLGNRIRTLDRQGNLGTLAGTGQEGVGDGPALQATFLAPASLAVAPDGTVYVGQEANYTLRRITPQGQVETLGVDWKVEGPLAAVMPQPLRGLAFTPAGELILSNYPRGFVTLIEGAGSAVVGGNAGSFRTSWGVAADAQGNVYVADPEYHGVHVLWRRGSPPSDLAWRASMSPGSEPSTPPGDVRRRAEPAPPGGGEKAQN
ncbi:MAG TPA: hypothetical protein VNO81_02315 [Candidatus Nitrosotenuis sp.]|jgi:streptogramin lyase|nr:hypothetical protein [Candidatus Nitrosotenuis sp.]